MVCSAGNWSALESSNVSVTTVGFAAAAALLVPGTATAVTANTVKTATNAATKAGQRRIRSVARNPVLMRGLSPGSWRRGTGSRGTAGNCRNGWHEPGIDVRDVPTAGHRQVPREVRHPHGVRRRGAPAGGERHRVLAGFRGGPGMYESGPFGEASGQPVPVAVETFQALRQRQTTDDVGMGASRTSRVNLLNWDGKGSPGSMFQPRPGSPRAATPPNAESAANAGQPPGPGSER